MAIHPLIQRVIGLSYHRGHGELPQKSVSEVRQYYLRHTFAELKEKTFEEIEVSTGVTCRIHRPDITCKLLPTVIYLRASAFVLGSINDTDAFCQALSQYAGCIVVAIEPRLAPEYKFPTQLHDCIEAIRYLVNHHQSLSINPKQLAIWGESSGGNLAASLSHQLNKEQSDFFQQQVLFYPMLDYTRTVYPSKQQYSHGYLMDLSFMNWLMDHYVTSISYFEDERVSPILAHSFDHLPRTLLIGAQYDPMRDEGQAYFEHLQKSDVPSMALFLQGMIHGFLTYANKVESAYWAREYAASYLKENFI
jgi:acetyl esterase